MPVLLFEQKVHETRIMPFVKVTMGNENSDEHRLIFAF